MMILYGASGHCKVVIDALKSSNNFDIDFVFDDHPVSKMILGLTVVKTNVELLNKNNKVIVTIGNNASRKKIVESLNCKFSNAVHSKAIISEFSKIDSGTVVLAGAVINADVTVGQHCIINSGAVVEHDCQIDNFVHVSPNASLAGNVHLGEGVHVGIGATVLQGISIGKWAVVGAGAVVLQDVPNFAVVVGNPARIIKYTNEI